MRLLIVVMLAIGAHAAVAARLKAPDGTIKTVPDDEATYLLAHGYSELRSVPMRDNTGAIVDVNEDAIGQAMSMGWRTVDATEVQAANEARGRRDLARTEREIQEDDDRRQMWTWIGAGSAFALLAGLYFFWVYRHG